MATLEALTRRIVDELTKRFVAHMDEQTSASYTLGAPTIVPNPDGSPTSTTPCGPTMVVTDVRDGTITLSDTPLEAP